MKTWNTFPTIVALMILVVSVAYLVISDDKPYTEDLGIYTVTAYCPKSCCCGRFADGITASGYKIKPGDRFVAAPPEMPFGTWLIVPGYNDGWAVEVLDRGGAIQGWSLDVYFSDHDTAKKWGRQRLRITKVNVREK